MSSSFPASPTTYFSAERPGCRSWSRPSGWARFAAAPRCAISRKRAAGPRSRSGGGETSAVSGHLLCFGFGYSARALARQLDPEWHLTGTSRGEPDGPLPADRHIRRLRFDRDHPLDPTAFAGITHVLVPV